MGWLTGWNYRRAILVSVGDELTDYQINIELDSNTFDFTKAADDGSDLRITLDDGETLIPLWIEQFDTLNQKASVWTKISGASGASITLYIYYGNSLASSVSNGLDVFESFDDFDTDTIDETYWTVTATDTYTTASDGEHLQITMTAASYGLLKLERAAPAGAYRGVARLKSDISTTNGTGAQLYDTATTSLASTQVISANTLRMTINTTDYTFPISEATLANLWARLETKVDMVAGAVSVTCLVESSGEVCVKEAPVTPVSLTTFAVGFNPYTTTATLTLDYAFTAKLVTNEPSISVSTQEETPPVSGWLTGWSYRRPITVSSSEDLTDFQVRIDLNSTNFDFTKINSDGSDIRITADDGTTLLPFWIEELDAVNQKATVWTKVPVLYAASPVTIYIYYGNSVAVAASDGNSVFELFDDFTGTEIDATKWTQGGGTQPFLTALDGDLLTVTANSTTGYGGQFWSSPLTVGSWTLECKARRNAVATGGTPGVSVGFCDSITGLDINGQPATRASGQITENLSVPYRLLTCYFLGGDTAVEKLSSTNPAFVGLWMRLKVKYYHTGADGHYEFVYPDGTTVVSDLDGATSATSLYAYFGYFDYAGVTTGDFDWIFVRKYASAEPTPSVGAEEQTTVLVASFSYSRIDNFTVQFTDNSEGLISSWLWDFGDGTTSTEQNPQHSYLADGVYQVSLTVQDNAGGSDTTTQTIVIPDPYLRASEPVVIQAADVATGGASFDKASVIGQISVVNSNDHPVLLDILLGGTPLMKHLIVPPFSSETWLVKIVLPANTELSFLASDVITFTAMGITI